MAVRNGNNQSSNKSAAVIAKFIKENGEKYTGDLLDTSMNWVTADDVQKFVQPTTMDFFREVSSRTTSPISDVEITLNKDQRALNLIFRNSLNLFEMGNPQYGEADKSNKKYLKQNIEHAHSDRNKVCVIYGGDLLGTEWELKRLNNAKIIEECTLAELKTAANEVGENGEEVSSTKDPGVVKKALYFSLSKRVNALKNDIRYALRCDDKVEVYLMNGAQEARINNYFKINVLQTVVRDLEKNFPGRIHYIHGVNTIVNVVKETEAGNRHATIGFLTNNSLSKSSLGPSVVSQVKKNSGTNLANVTFVTGTNIAGKKGANQYFVSGECTYMTTVQKKMPELSPKLYNVFSLRIPATHEIDVVEGLGIPKPSEMEMMVYWEQEKHEKMIDKHLEDYAARLREAIEPKTKDPVKTLEVIKSRHVSATAVEETPTEQVEPIVVGQSVVEDAKNDEVEEPKVEIVNDIDDFNPIN